MFPERALSDIGDDTVTYRFKPLVTIVWFESWLLEKAKSKIPN